MEGGAGTADTLSCVYELWHSVSESYSLIEGACLVMLD